MPMAIPLSLAHASGLPPVTGTHLWPAACHGKHWCCAACCWHVPVCCCLSPERTGGLPSDSGIHWWPAACRCGMLVAFLLSLAHTSGLLPVIGMLLWTTACHRHGSVAFCLSPSCTGGFCSLIAACHWPATCCQHAQVAFHLLPTCPGGLLHVTSVHRWNTTCRRSALVDCCLVSYSASGLSPVTGVHQLQYCLLLEHAHGLPPVASTCWRTSACRWWVPEPFRLSPARSKGVPPVTGMHRWLFTYDGHTMVPFCFSPAPAGVLLSLIGSLIAFRLSLACVCGLPPVTGMCSWPYASCWNMPVAMCLSSDALMDCLLLPELASGLHIAGMCCCPSVCHTHVPVPFHLWPACTHGLPTVIGVRCFPAACLGTRWSADTCRRSAHVDYQLSQQRAGHPMPFTGVCWWTAACRWSMPVACHLSLAHASGHSCLIGVCWHPFTCCLGTPVACCLSQVPSSGLPPVADTFRWTATCH